MQKINLQEPQRKRNATADFVNLIRTSTVLITMVMTSVISFFSFKENVIGFLLIK